MAKQNKTKNIQKSEKIVKELPPKQYVSDSVKNNWKIYLLFIIITVFMIFVKMGEEHFAQFNEVQVEENFYEIMNLPRTVTHKEIRKTYNKLASETHPDKNPDCKDCSEKFDKITKAYEVLSDKEKRKIYDETNGVVDYIKSTTVSLTTKNYYELVEESSDPWVIQIYSDTSHGSKSFATFWEEFSKDYEFIKFGRINYNSQKGLLKKIPFAVDELPQIYSYIPGREPEILEYDYDTPPSKVFRKFIKSIIPFNFKTIDLSELSNDEAKDIFNKKEKRTKIIYYAKDTMSSFFQFLSFMYSDNFDFYVTKPGQYRSILSLLGESHLDYTIVTSENFKNKPHNLNLKNIYNQKMIHKQVAKIIKFLAIPEINKLSFQDYCKEGLTNNDDNHLPNMCVILLDDSSNDKIEEIMTIFINKQKEYLDTLVKSIYEEKENTFEKIHRIQFGKMNLSTNWKFRDRVIQLSKVKNPKVFIYLSTTNQIKIMNNLGELGDIIEDAIYGEFDEFTNFKDIQPDYELVSLLRNESLNVFNILFKEIKNVFNFMNFLFLAFSLIVPKFGIKTKAYLQGYGVLILSMILFYSIRKMNKEGIL